MRKNRHQPTYKSWESMKQRLRHSDDYAHLDGDPRWATYDNFLADMGERPEGTSLDRRDNEKGYWPSNCRWATPVEQQRNRRPVQANTSFGITGITLKLGKYYQVYYPDRHRSVHLGSTQDFFEACCLRKSWEARNPSL